MDEGIWATWYDVDKDDEQSLHNWMHSSYFPHLRQLPGVAWVAHYAERGGGSGMRKVAEIVERSGVLGDRKLWRPRHDWKELPVGEGSGVKA